MQKLLPSTFTRLLSLLRKQTLKQQTGYDKFIASSLFPLTPCSHRVLFAAIMVNIGQTYEWAVPLEYLYENTQGAGGLQGGLKGIL